LNKLSIVYRKWWIKTAKVLSENPFAGVEPPRVDRLEPRRITPQEQLAFFSWFSLRWDGWRLPVLFLEVKAAIGCRITELAAIPKSALEDGRITFHAHTAKGRRTRRCKVPVSLYEELSALPGEFVWGSFSEGLREIHKKRGRHDHANSVRDFTPERMVSWLEDQQQAYFVANPTLRRFKLHNFRGLAMTKAKEMGVSYDDAATAFGCHPETMRRHYLALDEVMIADEVFDRLHASKK
jgi:hypothetical protein